MLAGGRFPFRRAAMPHNGLWAKAMTDNVDCSRFLDDRYLVSRLIAMDEAAWTFVVGDRILPSIAHSRKWREELCRLGVGHDAVATEVFLMLTANNCEHLRDFRFECAFSSRLYTWVLAAMQTIRRAHGKELPRDLSDHSGETYLSGAQPPRPEGALAAREGLAGLNRGIAALWKSNPVHAVVLILRDSEGLRSREVAAMLGLTIANVDQIHRRALASLRATCADAAHFGR